MKNQPFFSIIVPVYNVEKYLNKCILSVLTQKEITYELILIDDGSTDSSGMICDYYKMQYNDRIRVYHKKNEGQSVARNLGIKEAIGKYLFFLDSDDYIVSKDALKKVAEVAQNQDVIAFEWEEIYENTKLPSTQISYQGIPSDQVFTGTSYLERILAIHPGMPWYPCMYVYLNTYIQNKKFQFLIGHVYEDVIFTPQVILQARSVSVLAMPIYGYRRNRLGSTTTVVKRKSLEDHLFASEVDIDFVLKYPSLSNNLKLKLLSNFSEGYFSVMINTFALPMKIDQKIILDKLQQYRYMAKYALGRKQKIARILIDILGIRTTARILNLRRELKGWVRNG